jgi:threonine 3-dehydrogenase
MRRNQRQAPGEALIRVSAAGICGTDMAIYDWAPRMQPRVAPPRILGHEATGVVEALGAGVTHIKVGDRVSLESHIFCGECRFCRRGDAHLCQFLGYPGISIDGGFADRVAVPAQIARPVPAGMDDHLAAMIEPFGIAVHSCMAQRGVSGRTVLVNGCGPIGLMTVAAARALGARRVLAADPNLKRLKLAEHMGADLIIDPVQDRCRQGGPGRNRRVWGGGRHRVFRRTASGLDAVLAATERMGDIRLVAGPKDPHPLDVSTPFFAPVFDLWRTRSQALARLGYVRGTPE